MEQSVTQTISVHVLLELLFYSVNICHPNVMWQRSNSSSLLCHHEMYFVFQFVIYPSL